MGKLIDLTGKTFGKWKVLEKGPTKGRKLTWSCRCHCGKTSYVEGDNLRRNLSNQCQACANKYSATKRSYDKVKKKPKSTKKSISPKNIKVSDTLYVRDPIVSNKKKKSTGKKGFLRKMFGI